MKNKLTQSFVQNLKPTNEVVKVWDTLLGRVFKITSTK